MKLISIQLNFKFLNAKKKLKRKVYDNETLGRGWGTGGVLLLFP